MQQGCDTAAANCKTNLSSKCSSHFLTDMTWLNVLAMPAGIC